jgi:hypothetical protein
MKAGGDPSQAFHPDQIVDSINNFILNDPNKGQAPSFNDIAKAKAA